MATESDGTHVPGGDDEEIGTVLASWRYTGPPTAWEAIVGHERQIRRCQELVAKLERSPDELRRLGIHLGAGLLISGPAGVGKTLLARALATASRRMVVVPPVPELTPHLMLRLYERLSVSEPSVIILDEAEAIIGQPWLRSTEHDLYRTLLAALDGVSRPERGPITLALTTEPIASLEPAAIRPGRLAPHLTLGLPTGDERRLLLQRAAAGLPARGPIDLEVVVDRTAGWTGAELVGAVEAACTRSLVDHSDALRMDLLLEVVGEAYEVGDIRTPTSDELETWALHEAGHVIFGELTWPGSVESVALTEHGGSTQLAEAIERQVQTAVQLRRLVGMSYAGEVAEQLVRGRAMTSVGADGDRAKATQGLTALLAIGAPLDRDILEAGGNSDRGAERMRAALHISLEREAQAIREETLVLLAPQRAALTAFATALLRAPDQALSGTDLHLQLRAALSVPTFATPIRSDPDPESRGKPPHAAA